GRTPSLWFSLCLLFIEHWSQVYPIHVDPSRILFYHSKFITWRR
ncbi:Uncharacterized protein APZ42_001246, partial [Daphnia magna]